MYFDIDPKHLSGKHTQKVNKQNIRDLQNWVFDQLNEILNLKKNTVIATKQLEVLKMRHLYNQVLLMYTKCLKRAF